MRLGEWIQGLWRRRDRFDPHNLALERDVGYVREYSPNDFNKCVTIYKSNKDGRLPEGYGKDFTRFLRNNSILKLVVETGNEVAGIGGIYIDSRETELAWLTFGLVHADKQDQGLGTRLLLSRLALLPEPDAYWRIFMSSVASSVGFYKRFGFDYFGRIPMDDRPLEFDVYYTILTKNAFGSVRSILECGKNGMDLENLSVPSWP